MEELSKQVDDAIRNLAQVPLPEGMPRTIRNVTSYAALQLADKTAAVQNREADIAELRAKLAERHDMETRCVACMTIINTLRMDEGNSIDILCDNPDGPPNNAVECNGDWTEWETQRFEGDTLLTALEAAFKAYKATKSDWAD